MQVRPLFVALPGRDGVALRALRLEYLSSLLLGHGWLACADAGGEEEKEDRRTRENDDDRPVVVRWGRRVGARVSEKNRLV